MNMHIYRCIEYKYYPQSCTWIYVILRCHSDRLPPFQSLRIWTSGSRREGLGAQTHPSFSSLWPKMHCLEARISAGFSWPISGHLCLYVACYNLINGVQCLFLTVDIFSDGVLGRFDAEVRCQWLVWTREGSCCGW